MSSATFHGVVHAEPSTTVERVRVWSWPVRVLHWLVFLSVTLLAITGYYLGHPFVSVSGPARAHFWMGTAKIVHFYGAIVFTLAVLARVLYMFTGDKYANWRNFIPTTRERFQHLWETFKFYTFLRRDPPATVGHNALAGLAYVGVFGIYFLMILTGLAIYGVDARLDSPLHWFAALAPYFGGLQRARWIHHIGMWVLLAFVVQHVYSSILMTTFEKTGTVDSIFSGYKFFRRRKRDV